MKLWQIANYAQRQTLCGSVAPSSVSPFGMLDEHKATPGHRWRT